MSNSIRITLSAEELLDAGKMTGMTFSPLSPFRQADASSPQIIERIADGGKLRADLLPAFQALADARYLGGCAFVDSTELLDYSCYDSRDGNEPVSLNMAQEGIDVRYPAAPGEVLDWLAQHLGDSVLRKGELDQELSLKDAWVLFALLDISRRRALEALSAAQTGEIGDIDVEEIEKACMLDSENPQWLAPHFASCYDLQPLSTFQISAGVQNLADQHFVEIHGNAIHPGPVLRDLRTDFMFIQSHLRLWSASMEEDGQIRTTEVRCVRGQGTAALIWSAAGDAVHLMSASPAQVLMIARDILAGPFMQADQKKEMDSQETESTQAEMQIGASLPANEPVAAFSEPPQNKGSKKKKSRSGKKRRWWWIPIIVVVLLLLLILIWYATI